MTIVLWLKSDGKTVQELKRNEKYLQHWNNRHYVYIHASGELYTNRSTIRAKQMKQILERMKA